MSAPQKTTAPLRILHLEDDTNDIELVQFALKKAGVTPEVRLAHNRDEYEAALESGQFDVILSDNKVLGFDGTLALQMARERRPGTPFIFVSGSADHEPMREKLLRSGATDCVGKSNLASLAETLEKAVKCCGKKPAPR